MREGLHSSSHCTAPHREISRLQPASNSINQCSFNSSSSVALDGLVRASSLTLRAIFTLCDLELLLLHANKTASIANTLLDLGGLSFFWFWPQFGILLRSDGKSISNIKADFLEMNKTKCVAAGWLLLCCSINHLSPWLIELWLFTVIMSSWCSCHSSALAPSIHMYNRATCRLWMRHPEVESLSLPVWPH